MAKAKRKAASKPKKSAAPAQDRLVQTSLYMPESLQHRVRVYAAAKMVKPAAAMRLLIQWALDKQPKAARGLP